MTEHDVLVQLQGYGLKVSTLEFGKVCRVKVEGAKGEPGWYVLHRELTTDGRELFFGTYGDWRRGDEGIKIEFDAREISAEERRAFREKMDADRQRQREARAKLADEAAGRAATIWSKLPDAGRSDYLTRKRVRGFGLRYSRGSIVLPLKNVDGALVGLQFIDADGGKKFLTGTAKKGAYHLVLQSPADLDHNVLLIAEGYATAASLYMATGFPVAVCFDAGNLAPVANTLRSVYPNHRMIIAGDDDIANPDNPGRTKSTQAAAAVGARVLFPQFRGGAE